MALSRALARRVSRAPELGAAGRSPLLRNLAYLAGGQLATWTLTAIWTIVVPRRLGPAGMGELTIAWSAVAIVNVICDLGTGVLITRDVAHERSQASALVGAGMLIKLATVPVAWILILGYITATHFGGTQVLLLILATAGMQVSLITGVIQAGLQGIERMEYLAYADVLGKTLSTIAGIALVLSGFGVIALMVLSLLIAVVALALVVHWSRDHFKVTWRVHRRQIYEVVKGGLPFWITSIFLTAYIWVDSVMLSFMTSEAVVGWYGTATKLFATLLFIPAVMSTAGFPRLVAAFSEGPEPFRVGVSRVLGPTVILSFPISAGVIAIAGPLIGLIYGPRFAESSVLLALLGLLLPFTYLNIVASQALNASNRQLTCTKIMAVATVANVLVNLVLIPFSQARWHDGAIGASVSLLLTEILISLAILFYMRGTLGAITRSRVLSALIAAALMGALVWLLTPMGLAVQVVAGVLIFGALAYLLRIPSSEEIAMAKGLVGRLFSRAQPEETAA